MDLYVGKDYLGAFSVGQIAMLHQHAYSFFDAGFNFAGTFFGFGSTLFFYLLYKSRYIPRWLAVLGLVGSIAAVVTCAGLLIAPQFGELEFGWVLSLLAELSFGLWLVFVGTKPQATHQENKAASA